MNKNGDFYDKFEDVPEKFHTQIRPSMFPPPAEKLRCFNLNRWWVPLIHLVFVEMTVIPQGTGLQPPIWDPNPY